MRLLTSLIFKVSLSSMILTAPAMRTGNTDDAGKHYVTSEKAANKPFYTATVIRKFVDHPSVRAVRAVVRTDAGVSASRSVEHKSIATNAGFTAARAAELRLVIDQAELLYVSMHLDSTGLDQKAFEYAWRGYHNLLKKRMIRKRSVLSICDFSQSSSSKRMYVIDVRHKKLLYRTYVAHGQNSGEEYATSFSNAPDSYKSSLGFYLTQWTYYGRNGLSLRLNGVDSGFNDMAFKRNIVLHGSSYVSDQYMQEFGELGTSLGCPALPSTVSRTIIRALKGGSCLFIYHPTAEYLGGSSIING
ncbi:MAG TPA: murein L,D-transpeptidase catalytic domain family protein [Puia sp.]|jgi:hypothetical protein|nr:murein L,D-transpeptidase catalytic domain family protein [Puia sp.]